MSTPKTSHTATALSHWGDHPPEWVLVLAENCDRISQPVAAQRIGMTTSVISDTLRNKYKGRVDRVRERVMGAFMGKTVDCPVLGDDLARDTCLEKQKLPFAATNPERVRLFRMCPTCPHFRGRKATPSNVSEPEEK